MADALSIEEMNRTRAALGMPLLPVPSSSSGGLEFKKTAKSDDDESDEDPGSTLESRQALASDNWKKLQDEAEEKKRKEARRAALVKERNAAQKFAKLEGKGLGDAKDGDGELDTKAWLLGTNKRQKKIAKERAKMLQRELEEREKRIEYTEKDLAGQRVGHELGDFDEGEQILTLKDAAVDAEDEDDELENIDLRERERTKERNRLKLKKPVYDPNDEEEGGDKSILSHYDEEIDGKKKGKNFTLDGQGRTKEEARSALDSSVGSRQGTKISLDFLQDDKPVSDYMDISEVKIKKPKKKKKEKSKRQRAEEDDDIFPDGQPTGPSIDVTEAMDVEPAQQPNGVSKRRLEETSFADDDDLQSRLAAQRRSALKKRKLGRPEDIARRLREEASATPDSNAMETDVKGEDEEEGGLIIDETSEFVANLRRPEDEERRRAPSTQPANGIKQEAASASPPAVDDEDTKMDTRPSHPAEDEEDSDQEDAYGTPSQIKRETSTPLPPGETNTTTGLANEETFNNAGIGATLGMLTQRGIVKAAYGSDMNVTHSKQADFLRHKERLEKEWERKAQDKRKRDRDAGLFERMSKRQQEEYAQTENKQRDQFVSRQLEELFNREYKPNVELKYIDEHGRHMDQREAFKQMSHQFHGKGSGKLKTEKRLKKIDDEKRRDAQSALDSRQGTGMNNAMGTMGKKQGQAGVRLQ